MITLIQTRKSHPVPVILVDRGYWQPLLEWIDKIVYQKHQAISSEDRHIYTLVADAEEAFAAVKQMMANSKKNKKNNNEAKKS